MGRDASRWVFKMFGTSRRVSSKKKHDRKTLSGKYFFLMQGRSVFSFFKSESLKFGLEISDVWLKVLT